MAGSENNEQKISPNFGLATIRKIVENDWENLVLRSFPEFLILQVSMKDLQHYFGYSTKYFDCGT